MIFQPRTWPRFSARVVTTAVSFCATVLVAALCTNLASAGVTPESPEVQKLVNASLAFLERPTEEVNAEKLGGKCLRALVFVKAGRPDHARVREALEACNKSMQAKVSDQELDVYSNGLAIIFLCEYAPQKYAREIEYFLGRLKARQKPHGGWGYATLNTGDTSQTQYGALSYWEAHRHGFNVDAGSVDNLADWLMHTQGPDGCWGYQGAIAPGDEPVPQDERSCSLLAAGLGATYICCDLFGFRPETSEAKSSRDTPSELPSALRRVEDVAPGGEPKKLHSKRTNPAKIARIMGNAHNWMAKNYQIDIGEKVFYYLYGLERYKSFQEAFESSDDKSPKWYNDGYEFLAKTQAADGSWSGYCQAQCDTAFAVLFLLRSTQKSIRAKLGEGMLLAGRGLPTNLNRAKLRNGQLIVDQVHTKVDELLSMIDDGNEGVLDDLARDPSQLVVDQVDEKSARRLQQLVHGGDATARLLAVRALGRTGNLDYVPTLLYALTDPDHRVVLEARNELRFISRNFDGLGPPDDFTEQQRYQAVDAWKKWYKSIRPAAVLEK
jgi:hypothetical protein